MKGNIMLLVKIFNIAALSTSNVLPMSTLYPQQQHSLLLMYKGPTT